MNLDLTISVLSAFQVLLSLSSELKVASKVVEYALTLQFVKKHFLMTIFSVPFALLTYLTRIAVKLAAVKMKSV